MTPPTPAAVRAALSRTWPTLTEDEQEALREDKRMSRDILIDHLHAIAAEMREHAEKCESDGWYTAGESLRLYADRLEGKQP